MTINKGGVHMATLKLVQDFLDQKTIAVIGVSRSPKKFSRMVYDAFKKKGYTVYAVNPNAENIEADVCYKNIHSLPKQAEGIVIITPSKETEKIVRQALDAGITRIWIQQGAESEEAILFCRKNGLKVIDHQCICMFLQPQAFPHNIHRFIWKLVGKMPK
jgi:predicted CoA-binding protein